MGIRGKLVSIMSSLVIILLTVTGWLILQKQKAVLLAKTVEVCDTTAAGLNNVAQDNLLTGMHAPIQEFIVRLLNVKLHGLQYIQVADKDLVVVAHSDPSRIGQKTSDVIKEWQPNWRSEYHIRTTVYKANDNDIECLEFSYPIVLTHNKKEFLVGFSTIGFSKKEIYRSIAEASRIIISISLTVLLGALAVVTYTAHMIVKPVKLLSQQSRQIAKGNLDVRIRIKSKDELGRLSQDFNEMTESLSLARKELIEKTRMEHELETARLVQSTLFPDKDFEDDYLELSGFYESSAETGGDWFGFISGGENHEVNVFIGDVTGHGAAAALVTSSVNSLFSFFNNNRQLFNFIKNPGQQRMAQDILAPGAVMQNLNIILHKLSTNVSYGMNMTAICSRILPGKGMTYANAGHNFPYIFRAGEEMLVLNQSRGMRLGDVKDSVFAEAASELRRGDIICWYTDGLIECENGQGLPYGKKRLRRCLFECAKTGLKARETKERLAEDAFNFYGRHPLKDDVTFVIGKIK